MAIQLTVEITIRYDDDEAHIVSVTDFKMIVKSRWSIGGDLDGWKDPGSFFKLIVVSYDLWE